jgi:hypothetical protein
VTVDDSESAASQLETLRVSAARSEPASYSAEAIQVDQSQSFDGVAAVSILSRVAMLMPRPCGDGLARHAGRGNLKFEMFTSFTYFELTFRDLLRSAILTLSDN